MSTSNMNVVAHTATSVQRSRLPTSDTVHILSHPRLHHKISAATPARPRVRSQFAGVRAHHRNPSYACTTAVEEAARVPRARVMLAQSVQTKKSRMLNWPRLLNEGVAASV